MADTKQNTSQQETVCGSTLSGGAAELGPADRCGVEVLRSALLCYFLQNQTASLLKMTKLWMLKSSETAL